jgi:hypothetical protein
MRMLKAVWQWLIGKHQPFDKAQDVPRMTVAQLLDANLSAGYLKYTPAGTSKGRQPMGRW